MGYTLPDRSVVVAELDATIRRAERQVLRYRLALAIAKALGREAPATRTHALREAARVASLLADRRFVAGFGTPPHRLPTYAG